MLIILLLLLLVSSAVIIKRDKSTLFSRVIIQSLLFSIYLVYNNLYTFSSINTYIIDILQIVLINLVTICLIDLCLVWVRYLINKLFRRETLINFGLSILLFFFIKGPASLICSQLNTPWLYIIILGITSILYSMIKRILWDRELYKATQLILIGLLPALISIIMQWVDIDLMRAFFLISSSILMSVGSGGHSTIHLYMNPSDRISSSAGQGNSDGESSRSAQQSANSQDSRSLVEGKGKKRVRSDSSEKGYPNHGWTSINKPVGWLELDSTRKSNTSTVSISTSNSSPINKAGEVVSSSRSNHINVSQQVNNTSGSNIISQLPLEERFNVVSTSANNNQLRSINSKQVTDINRETNPQQVVDVKREASPQQVINLRRELEPQQVITVPPIQVGTDNGTGYGDYYTPVTVDARPSIRSQQLFRAGYALGSPFNREAGRRMSDHLLFLSRLGTRPNNNSFTPDMLKWLSDWSYHNDRELHDAVFLVGWKQPNYKRLKINDTIRRKLADLD